MRFKYKIISKNNKTYDVCIRYDRNMSRYYGKRTYCCSLRSLGGIIMAVETIIADNKAQALILLQYRELCQ